MKINIENWSIAIVGSWNTAIINPGWLTKTLSLEGLIGIEFPIGNPHLPIRYNANNVLIVARQDALVLAPKSNLPEVLSHTEIYASKILRTLTHTPVAAVGINFDFVESDPPSSIRKLFNFEDRSAVAESGFIVKSNSIRRLLLHEATGTQINLTISRDESSNVTLNFNFHKEVASTENAAEYIENKMIEFKNQATTLLQSVYELELEEVETT